MITIYIDDRIADLNTDGEIGFNLTAAFRDITKFGSVEGFELDDAATVFTVPVTRTNRMILEGTAGRVLSFRAIADGRQVFSGQCTLATVTYSNDVARDYALDVWGGNAELLASLADTSLRDLDLGEKQYTELAITTSWGNSCDDEAGMYAPAVYGLLASGNENEWAVVDFRYHVYFDAILKAIAKRLGVSLQSTFLGLDIWRKALFANTVGDAIKAVTNTVFSEVVQPPSGIDPPTTDIDFFPAETGVFEYTLTVAAGATYPDPDIDGLILTTTSGFSLTIPLNPATGLDYAGSFYELAGNTVVVRGDKSGTLAALPYGLVWSVFGDYRVTVGDSFLVSSCLPDVPVRDFLAQIATMFNLVLFYQPVQRRLLIEPALAYKIGSTTYEGFYKTDIDPERQPLELDVTEYATDLRLEYDAVRLQYADVENLDDFVRRRTQSNAPPLSVRATVAEGDRLKDVGGNLFTRCYAGSWRGITTATQVMPLLVKQDIRGVGDTPQEADYEGDPTFFYVTSEVQSIVLDGDTLDAPICSQYNVGGSEGYTMSYSDVINVEGATSTTVAGLASIFYRRHWPILRRPLALKADLKLRDILAASTFRRPFYSRGDMYLLSRLEDVTLESTLRKATLYRYTGTRSEDLEAVTGETFTLDVLKLQING